ncbi:MAG: tRNA guanosine(34) transglycosylase Tgt, partial [Patescibacteria group bacterium]
NHGSITTPIFLPDATRGYVKLLSSEELKSVGVKCFVVNTFHLYLQPGLKIIKKVGGIHKFMNWQGPILSDSGGYQVYSLIHKNPQMGKINDEGAVFKSPLDGSMHSLTPEKSIQIQFDLGIDMMVCLDDCPPNDAKKKDLKKSVERTIFWAKRCKIEYDKQIKKRKLTGRKKPLIFSVIQGGADLKLRKYCAEELIKIGWDGYGFGARPVDKEGKFLDKVLKFTADLIPEKAIKFALGIGKPEDIIRCVKMGWQMFDCVIPTREGRHGRLFLWKRKSNIQIPIRQLADQINSKFKIQNSNSVISGQISKNLYKTININNSKFSADNSAINMNSKLPELREYSKAYLHHLFKMNEPLGQKLATLNNLEFYLDMMKNLR